ncbi:MULTISPECIES: hypothetical protein [unclassified Ruegeria]|nr:MULTISPECIES: hypothetical protein [unclassified Ruegeria]
MFRHIPALLAVLAIVACTPQDVPIGSRSAQFPSYPENLFSSFETDCAGPGEDFFKNGRNSAECHEVLPPEATAFLILRFGGYPQDLPKIVTRLESSKNSDGYRVDADLYFLVPQQNGDALRVPVEGTALDQTFSQIYLGFGGEPV